MDQRRWLSFILASCVIYAFFIIVYWLPYEKKRAEYHRRQREQAAAAAESVTTGTAARDLSTTPSLRAALPPTSATKASDLPVTSPALQRPAEEIVVHTPLYRVVLTSEGGRPRSWQYLDPLGEGLAIETIEMIPQRPDSPERELPFEVVFKESNRVSYPEFNTAVYDRRVAADDGTTKVIFTSPVIRDLQLTKTYEFRREGYLSRFEVLLRNLGEKSSVKVNDDGRGIGVSWGPGVRQFTGDQRPDLSYVNLVYGTPRGAGYAGPREPAKDPKDDLRTSATIQWAGATDKFFLAAIIPDGFPATSVHGLVRVKNVYPKEKARGDEGYHSPPFTVILYNERFELEPQRQAAFAYNVFVGPKRPKLLREIGRATNADLERVLFYQSWFGWMRWLKIGLMHSLSFLFAVVGSYGWAIVILTILIRVATHPLAHKGMKIQAKTMAEMQKIKPLLDEVNRKHKGDAAKRNQEMMRLYREHNISPLAPLRGCLPMLIQIPIFFALYSFLIQSIDLRGASFLWIDDLSGPDKLVDLTRRGLDFRVPLFGWHVMELNLLPILMGASQYFMSKLTPTPSRDPTQKQMMLIFSLIFPIMLYSFPSGLFIYWLINNVWQTVHQLIANRLVRKPPEGQAAMARA